VELVNVMVIPLQDHLDLLAQLVLKVLKVQPALILQF